MSATCEELLHVRASEQCAENFAGIGSVIYYGLKDDLSSPLVEDGPEFKTLAFKAGKGLYRIDCKEEANSIVGSSGGQNRGYIQTLQQQKETLEKADKALDQAIKDLKTELSGDIASSSADVLAQLDAYKSIVAGQINSINAAIAALQTKDSELQQQITTLRNYVENDLKTYIDNGDQSVKNWASTTFVTLEQYNATAEIIAGIQGQITSINQQIAELGETVAGVTREELNTAISGLDTKLQGIISQSVSDCNTALTTAKQEITSAYTTAIQSAISSSESAWSRDCWRVSLACEK